MRLRSLALVQGLILAGGLVGFCAPAVAAPAEPSGWLEVNAGPSSSVHRLTPGGSAHWPVDVFVRGEPASSLEVELQPGAAGSDLLQGFISVELRACSQPWIEGQCGAGQRVLLQRTALSSAVGFRADLTETGASVPAGSHVLLTATLAEDVPREVQGSGTRILLGVHGSGDDPGSGSAGHSPSGGQPAGQPLGSLADTGARLGGFAFLGLLAVAVGFGLARLRTAAA